jgi:Acyltransferase family
MTAFMHNEDVTVSESAPRALTWKRLDGIDLLRGLSIFFVLMNHINIRLLGADVPYTELLPAQLVHILVWNTQLGVQMFFAISGFLITSITIRRWGSLPQVSLRGFYLFRFARGPGLNLSHSHDYFFTGGALAPNESESLRSCPIRLVLQPKNGEPFAETRHATIPVYAATMRVELVQYSDGSIWGDQDAAAEVHQFPRYTLDKIESLQQVYSGQGEKAFMEALEEPIADQCFEQIKATCRSQSADSSCVRKAIQQMVATAAQQRDLEAQ